MFLKKKLLQNLINFASKMVEKCFFFLPKYKFLRLGSIIFYFFLFSQYPKNFGGRFFKFILSIAIIMLKKLEILEIYQKN